MVTRLIGTSATLLHRSCWILVLYDMFESYLRYRSYMSIPSFSIVEIMTQETDDTVRRQYDCVGGLLLLVLTLRSKSIQSRTAPTSVSDLGKHHYYMVSIKVSLFSA